MRAAVAVLAGGLGGALAAQQRIEVVVPSAAATAEASGSAFWACAPFESRRQVLIAESQLAGLKGRVIEAIAVRRNADINDELRPGQLSIEIALSHSPRSPAAPSARFADNRGPDHVVVFDRPVTLPSVPPARTVPAGWQTPEGLEFRLSRGFHYLGGTLCIETVTRLRGAAAKPDGPRPWWTVDAATADAPGSARSLGTSCITDLPEQPAGAEPAFLAPGGTAVFWLRGGRTTGPAVFLLGARDPDLDLTAIGAPGCRLRTDLAIQLPLALAQLPESPIGLVAHTLPLPANASLAGRSLFAQWLVLDPKVGPLGLALSNGVEATLGRPATASAACIEGTAADASSGLILFGQQPVLRFGLAGS